MGKMKSRTNSSRKSTMCTELAPYAAPCRGRGSAPRPAEIGAEGDDLASVALDEPAEDDGRVEAARIARTTRLGAGAVGSGIFDRRSEQIEDDGLLGVQPVLGLVEHDAGLAVEYGVGDLLATVRGSSA